jgi:hypothetical protein
MAGVMAARSIGPAIRRVVALVTLLLGSAFGIVGGTVEAQVSGRPTDQDLRLEWTAAEDRRGRPIVSGYVYN